MSATLSFTTQTSQAASLLMQALSDAGKFAAAKDVAEYHRALAPLLEALGWHGDVRQLSDALPVHAASGFTLFDLYNCMAYLGYDYQPCRCALKDLRPDMMPCLFEQKQSRGQPVSRWVVVEVMPQGIRAVSLDHGQEEVLMKGQLQGHAVCFSRRDDSEDSAKQYARSKTGFTWFRGVMERFESLIWQVAAIGAVIHLAALAVPVFVMVAYDHVIGARSLQTLPYLVAGVVIAILMESVLRYLRSHALAWLGARVNAIVSVAMYERLLFLAPAYTERASVPSQLARLRAFEMVRDFFSGAIFLALLELPFTLVLLAAIALIAGPLAWVGVAVGVLYVLILKLLHRQITYHIHCAARSLSEKQHMAVEAFTRLDQLRLCGMTDAVQRRFAEFSARAVSAQMKSGFLSACVEHISQALSMLAGVATLAFGVTMIWSGELSIGALVATMILTWRLLSPLQTACAMLPRLEHVRSSIEQINRLMNLRPERMADRRNQGFDPFAGDVVFSQVGLRYTRTADPVFSNLSMHIASGKMLVIVGGNGSGKSSVLKLTAGLYVPQVGMIRIDGADLRQIDPVLLRRNVSYVAQYPHLFSGSIFDNLRLAAPLAGEEEIRRALIQADAWSDVQHLSGGMYHAIEHLDHHLSSGVLARIELARLYLSAQSLVLCDELPGSVMSSRAGSALVQFLNEQKGKKTLLVVSHQREIVAMADHVLWLRREHVPRLLTPQQALALLEEDAW